MSVHTFSKLNSEQFQRMERAVQGACVTGESHPLREGRGACLSSIIIKESRCLPDLKPIVHYWAVGQRQPCSSTLDYVNLHAAWSKSNSTGSEPPREAARARSEPPASRKGP